MSHNDAGAAIIDGVLTVFAFVFIISAEHWIMASLLWGAIGFFACYAINDRAQSNAGAVLSGLLANAFAVLFGFGVFAAAIALIKFVWLAA